MPNKVASIEAAEISGTSVVPIIPGKATKIDNELFDGHILFLVRDPTISAAPPGKRLFELQMQGRFKSSFDNMFMGMELAEPLKPGLLFRAAANSTTAFVKSFEPDIHTSFGSMSEGRPIDLPHIVTPGFKGCDYVLATPPGETPPVLGSDVTCGKRATKHEKSQWSAAIRGDCTYTLCTFSTFVDFYTFKAKGLPFGPLDLGSLFGRDNAMRIVVYTMRPHADAERVAVELLSSKPGREAKAKDSKVHALANKVYALNVQVVSPNKRRHQAVVADGSVAMVGNGDSVAHINTADAGAEASASVAASRRTLSERATDALADVTERIGGRKRRRKKSTSPTSGSSSVAGGYAAQQPRPWERPEAHPQPPLFRTAFAMTEKGNAHPDDGQGAMNEDELAAQQRLLLWMAGTPPKTAKQSGANAGMLRKMRHTFARVVGHKVARTD